jgi:serine/threonine protein kinase
MVSSSYITDKVVHGIVAFISTLGFEMLAGTIREENHRVSFSSSLFRIDDEQTGYQCRRSDVQLFTAFFKRPPPKTSTVSYRAVSDLLPAIQTRLSEIVHAKSADAQTCLCSEDLAGIKELTLLGDWQDGRSFSTSSSDFPQSYREQRMNHRVLSQPVQGFGHRPIGQLRRPLRYKLVIIGVNQAGFLSFVHMMLMLSHFRIIEADIQTIRGTYAQNTYIVETYSAAAERLLRAHFQCVVPIRSSIITSQPYPFYHEVPLQGSVKCGVWLDGGLSSYHGNFSDGVKQGFGRFWSCSEKQSLATYSYEGDWDEGLESGYGFKLEAVCLDKSVVKYSFGRFFNGQLIDGCVLYPYEPPAKSVRIDRSIQPDQCVYRTLIQRAEFWRRQLPRSERPVSFLSNNKIRPMYGCQLRAVWTMFSESPVPSTSAMTAWQVAALLEAIGLQETAKTAFAKRIDGGLLEAMTDDHLRSILGISSESQRVMLVNFIWALAKAHNIDRHMRQPAAVLDPLVNPAVGGRLLPLDKMRVVESLGEGAYGKVMYAEYVTSQLERTQSGLPKTVSNNSLISKTSTPVRSQSWRTPPLVGEESRMSEPSLFSALTRRSVRVSPSQVNLFVALKEQVGSGAQLENSCELIREWATLNALPHENIVKLEGICADTNAPMFNRRYLATALVEASLPSLIYNQDGYGPAPELTPLLTLQLAGDIASGLAHMHSLFLLHGDIKSPNVLVDIRARDRPVGRLCDFGHAAIRVGPRPQRRMCTFGWAAPESLRDTETDISADVWSWAAVCWEMYVREMPWRGCTHAQMVVAVGHCGLDPSGFKGSRMPERVKAERIISSLCKQCFSLDPTARPSMERVLHIVDKLGRIYATHAVAQLESLLQ